jgi:hypothetical protein
MVWGIALRRLVLWALNGQRHQWNPYRIVSAVKSITLQLVVPLFDGIRRKLTLFASKVIHYIEALDGGPTLRKSGVDYVLTIAFKNRNVSRIGGISYGTGINR